MKNVSLPLFQEKASLHRPFLSKKGKNLNKTFLAFHNSLKFSHPEHQYLNAKKDTQESISGFILKRGNFQFEDDDGDKSPKFRDNLIFKSLTSEQVEKNISKMNIDSIKQFTEERRQEIRDERKFGKKKKFMKVDYKGTWKNPKLPSFPKSKRNLSWLTPNPPKRKSIPGQKISKSTKHIPRNLDARRKFRIKRAETHNKNQSFESMRSMNLPSLKVHDEGSLRHSFHVFRPSIADLSTTSNSRSPQDIRNEKHKKAKRRYKLMNNKKFKMKKLNKEINELRKERARRMFEELESRMERGGEEKRLTNSVIVTSCKEIDRELDNSVEKKFNRVKIPKKAKKNKNRQFSHLFFQKLKRRKFPSNLKNSDS